MDRSTSDRDRRGVNADQQDAKHSGVEAGRSSLTADQDNESESVEWEAVSGGEYDVGNQLAHLGKEAASGTGSEKATSEREHDEEKEESEDEEGEAGVETSFAPDADSGGDGSGGGDEADDDDDDDDDDDRSEPGARTFTARAASANGGGTATAAASRGGASASEKWQEEITKRDEQRNKVKRQPRKRNADTNAYNNKKVRANHLAKSKKKRKHQIDRAGVRFREQDKFAPIAKRVPRYRIIEGNIATSEGVKDAVRGGKDRLAINPAHSRNLVLEDGTKLGPCVLTWHGGRRAAWIPISQIKLATTRTDDPAKLKAQQAGIKRAVDRRANQWKSKVASSKALKEAAHFEFGGSGADAGPPTSYERTHYVVPNQRSKGANKVSDYLRKEDGKTFNVMINLPRDRQAPIAVDTTVTGDHFFVPRTGGVVQEISIYKRGKNETKVRGRQTWVFGHVGTKAEDGGEPDTKRRGWVPLRVLDPVKPT